MAKSQPEERKPPRDISRGQDCCTDVSGPGNVNVSGKWNDGETFYLRGSYVRAESESLEPG